MTERRRKVRTAAALGAAVLVLHWGWLLLGLPGGRLLTDFLFVAAPLFGTVACVSAARRLVGPARVVWFGLAGVSALWVGANSIWGWYEVVLHQTVPVPSPADWLFASALVVAAATMILALLPLVDSRAAAIRIGVDVLVVGTALVYVAWIAAGSHVGGDGAAPFLSTVTWLYPALDVVAVTVAFAVMTRVSARSRLPWLVLGGAFLTGACADTVWAYRNLHDGYVTGGLVDPLWVVVYLGVGLSALVVTGDARLRAARLVPARWESLAAYVPVLAAVVVTLAQELRHELSPAMLMIGTSLVPILVVRQVIAVLENHRLTASLEQRVAERTSELRASEEHFRSIVQSISDVVIILDDAYRVRYQSPAAGRLLGYDDDEMVGRFAADFAHPGDLRRGILATERLAENGLGHTEIDTGRVRHKDGSWRHMEISATDLYDHPEVNGLVLAMRDVGDRVALEERLRHDAFHDSLTGLANRALLHTRLETMLAAERHPSLVLLDLDEFKALNDTSGHDLGDEVLIAVGQRLREATRPEDVVARLGGDEFALVVPDDPGGAAATSIAHRILDGLRSPMTVRGRQVRCLASIGVATAGPRSTPADLLRDADVAMYVAKDRGRARVEMFTAGMREDVLRRRRIEDLLRRAVVDDRLVLLFQPVIDLASDQIVGAEALLRLRDDGDELVSPLEFIPLAEETGLIVEIGEWVLVEACRKAAEWQEMRPDGPPLSISVNVSTRQLHDSGLAGSVADALDLTGLDASLLTLEITEGALADADAEVELTLRALRRLGVRLSIDDFGAGYSSLGRLRHLQVDELKIDRSFISELVEGVDAPLVDAILAIAQRLGLSVVAEGIETIEQAVELRGRRCGRGQGFLYARPLSADALVGALAVTAVTATAEKVVRQ
jgi:diguanylate cyclase (GGDEF)-like protein/PAS domain S-box-containing protein